jgi:hypothetical protein
MNSYQTSPITQAGVDTAFLLIEAANVGIDRDAWNEFCHRIIEWRGATGMYDDVLLARNEAGHIKGLFVSQTMQSLLFGRIMDVPLFVTASAADEDGVHLAMLDVVRERARLANCGKIRVWSQGGQSWRRIVEATDSGIDFHGIQIELG